MGGWANRIGHYEVSQMDYYYDGIEEENQTLEYYKAKIVNVKFKNLKTKAEKIIAVPLSDLHDFVKHNDSDLYYMSSDNEDKSLRNWLWNKLKSSNIRVVSAFKLNIHLSNSKDWSTCPNYYLNSRVGDENIKISIIPVELEITSIEQINWLGARGFYYA